MEIKKCIKAKISQYLSNEVSKEAISKWALEVMRKMLRGDIFEISNAEVWGIITELTQVNDIDDTYSDELILKINRILLGEENNSYSFFIQIPEKYVLNNLLETEDILVRYQKEGKISNTDFLVLESITKKAVIVPNTINEILEMHIRDLLILGYCFYVNEGSINFNLKHTVFADDDNSMEVDYLAKIIALLACYNGKKGFAVHISFCDRIGTISIQA